MRQTINDEDVMKLQTWLKKKDKFCDEYYLTYFSLSGPSRLGEHDVKEFLTTLSVTLNSLVLHRSQSSIKKNIRIPEVYFFLSAHESTCISRTPVCIRLIRAHFQMKYNI